MNKQERYERGSRLMDDAHFVKQVFLSAAFEAGRWNLVLFEAYRAAELLVKGIFYLAVYEPKQHHRLHDLVARLSEILEQVPFIYRAVEANGNYFQVAITPREFQLLKQINGAYTLLDSSCRPSLPNPYVPPRLVRNGSAVSIWQGDQELLNTCDSDVTANVSYEKKVLCPPDANRLGDMKQLVEVLYATREEAFYSARHFTRAEAELSKSNLDLVFQLSKAFEFFERV